MRIPAAVVVSVALWATAALDARSEEDAPAAGAPIASEAADDYSVLFPLGVRGLEGRYDREPGGKKREQAIREGLAWLAAHQTPGGAWNPEDLSWCNGQAQTIAPDGKGRAEYVGGVTGLALCAFLGAGYTEKGKHPYALAIARGLAWLVKSQDEGGCLAARTTQHYIYNHAFGTLALLEAYAASGDPQWLAAGQRALSFSAAARNPGFAWRYGIRPGDNDTSATGCMSLSIHAGWRMNQAARAGGVFEPFEFDTDIYDGVRAWIDQVTDGGTGRVGYISSGMGPARPMETVDAFPGERSEAMTAIGVLLRSILPRGDEKRDRAMIDKGVERMNGLRPRWDPGGGYTDLYYWYYASMAMQHRGGKDGAEWSKALAEALLPSQRKDSEVCAYRGSWDPTCPWGPDGGRIYSTAMAILALQAPVRAAHLPQPRTDLLDALDSPIVDVSDRVRLVRGISVYDLKGSADALDRVLGEKDVTLRCAAALALGRLTPGRDVIAALANALKDEAAPVRVAAARAHAELARRTGKEAVARAVPGLLHALQDPEGAVRAAVADALGASEAAEVVEPLVAALDDPDLGVRVAVAGAHWRLAQDAARGRPHLEAGLQDAEPTTRREAARHLEAVGPAAPWSQALLVAALQDADGLVRVRACRALWRVAPPAGAMRAALAACLEDEQAEVRRLAIDQYGAMRSDGAVAANRLVRLLFEGPIALRVAAADALGSIGATAQEAAPALGYVSRRGPRALRATARTAVKRMALPASVATSVLVAALDAKDRRLVQGAIWGLADVGAEAVPALADRLRSDDAKRVLGALDALEAMGPAAVSARQTLKSLLASAGSERVRTRAATVIGSIGPAASGAAPTLIRHLMDKSEAVRMASVHALARLAPASRAAVDALAASLTREGKEHAALRAAAAAGLGGIGAAAAPAVPALLQCLWSEEQGLRGAAIRSLGDLGPLALDNLRGALLEPQDKVREGAAEAIERIGEAAADAAPELILVFERGKDSGKNLAVRALVAIGEPAVKPLIKGCKSKLAHVRFWCARALGSMGPVARSAKRRLKGLLKDKDGNVRSEAARALERISER